jgi:hypothetical protein
MSIKCVIIFQMNTNVLPNVVAGGLVVGLGQQIISAPAIGYTSRTHVGGWSESVLWLSDSVADLQTALRTGFAGAPALLPARAALLPSTAGIVGVRFYQGGAGKGQTYGYSYPGDPSQETDIPQVAVLCKGGPTSFAVTRRWTLRGVPDNQVTAGEFTPTQDYTNRVATYFSAMGNFGFRGIDPTIAPTPLLNVNAAGLFSANVVNQPFAVGNIVTISKALNAQGNFRKFVGQVTAIGPLNNQFTMAAWPFGACTGGTARVKTTGVFYLTSQNSVVVRALVRKIGRPFEQYRGRRSKRRPQV